MYIVIYNYKLNHSYVYIYIYYYYYYYYIVRETLPKPALNTKTLWMSAWSMVLTSNLKPRTAAYEVGFILPFW